ncbi:MAG: hypothetical protein RLZZ616_1832 [Pseudomonadota bacterium]|jgi:hypothetical protein
MVVKDELMRIAPQTPPGVQLTLRSQPSLAEALGDNQLSRDLVEQAFGQLAAPWLIRSWPSGISVRPLPVTDPGVGDDRCLPILPDLL